MKSEFSDDSVSDDRVLREVEQNVKSNEKAIILWNLFVYLGFEEWQKRLYTNFGATWLLCSSVNGRRNLNLKKMDKS
jgi:hypothetical protein